MNLRSGLVLFLILGVLAMSTVGLAQDTQPSREETLIFATNAPISNPENYNPLVGGSVRDFGFIQAITEPLFLLNYTTGQIDPWLGVSFESNETLDVWTLTLREGVKWQDGEDFNADDVVFTINMLIENAPRLTDSSAMKQWVASVEKIDDLRVEFTLTEPNPRFQLDYFAAKVYSGVIILPEHIWAGQDPETFTFYDPEQGWPVGTGPYRAAYSNTNEVAWDRDDNWWGAQTGFMDLPAPKRLIWQSVVNEETLAAALINDELDMTWSISVGTMEAIRARNPNVIAWYSDMPYAWSDPCPRALTINTTVAPWDSVALRRTLTDAINREQIVQLAYEGANTVSDTIFVAYDALSPYTGAIREAGLTFSPTADLEAFRAAVEAAGYTQNANGIYEKDGTPLSMELLVHESIPDMRRTSEVLVEQFRLAGIDASLQVLAGGTWFDNISRGQFEGFVSWMPCGSVNEPWATMNWANNAWLAPIGEPALSGSNMGRWDNPEYSAIVDEIGQLPLGEESIPGLVVEAMEIWMEEMPAIPLVQAALIVPADTTYWTNWPTADNPYSAPTFWWQTGHVIIHNVQPAAGS